MGTSTILGVPLVAVSIHDGRVTAMGFLDHRWVERSKVVRTNQPERNLRINRHIEQRLMQLAFENLLGSPPRPNRLADSAYGTAVARVLIHKLLPGRDDACWVLAELGHVNELDLASLGPQALAQPRGMASHDCDHDRLACREPIFDERPEE